MFAEDFHRLINSNHFPKYQMFSQTLSSALLWDLLILGREVQHSGGCNPTEQHFMPGIAILPSFSTYICKIQCYCCWPRVAKISLMIKWYEALYINFFNIRLYFILWTLKLSCTTYFISVHIIFLLYFCQYDFYQKIFHCLLTYLI